MNLPEPLLKETDIVNTKFFVDTEAVNRKQLADLDHKVCLVFDVRQSSIDVMFTNIPSQI